VCDALQGWERVALPYFGRCSVSPFRPLPVKGPTQCLMLRWLVTGLQRLRRLCAQHLDQQLREWHGRLYLAPPTPGFTLAGVATGVPGHHRPRQGRHADRVLVRRGAGLQARAPAIGQMRTSLLWS
jgi:hypothetical protein